MAKLASFNPSVPAASEGRRRAMLAKVHLAKKALGLEDEDYRAILKRETGRESARDCSLSELDQLIGAFRRRGFKSSPASSVPRRRASHPVAKKARALWISLHALDAIADPSEAALDAFARRQLRVDRLQWADQSQGFLLVEALKAIAERHGWSQTVPHGIAGADAGQILKERLVALLASKLADAGEPLADIDPAAMTDADLDAATVSLGTRYRALRAGKAGA